MEIGCRRPRLEAGMAGFRALARNPDAFAVAVALVGEGQSLGHLAIALATGIGVPRIYRGIASGARRVNPTSLRPIPSSNWPALHVVVV